MGAAEAAKVVATALAEGGSTVMFGVPGGGNNLEIIGAAEAAGIRFVLAHAETAATIMAAVDLTGEPTAVVVTRGPGAASAVNGVAQARLDRQPLVVLTDAVSTADHARVSHQRIDQRALFGPVAKATGTLGSDDGAAEVAERAVRLASEAPGGRCTSTSTGPRGRCWSPAAPAGRGRSVPHPPGSPSCWPEATGPCSRSAWEPARSRLRSASSSGTPPSPS